MAERYALNFIVIADRWPHSSRTTDQLKDRFSRVPIFPISANEGTGLPELIDHLDSCIGRMEV
jgi:hypothetical protein